MEYSFPAAVDSTMMSTYDSCPRKFLIEYVAQRSPSGKSIHLHAGGCFASAMEDVRNFFYRDGLDLEECLVKAFDNFIRNWDWMDPPEGSYKDFVNMWGAVEAYFQEYPPATDHFQPVMKADGSPATEFHFSIPTNVKHPDSDDPIMFAGRADMLATNDPSCCYVVDEKTTSSLGTRWYNQWDMRGQFFGYTYAARQTGWVCAGALVRGVAIQQTKYGFGEKLIYFTNGQLEEWWATFNQKLRNMVSAYQSFKKTLEIPGNDDDILTAAHYAFLKSYGEACGSYGGCQFVSVCLQDKPWNHYRTMERRVWNPAAKDPTSESEDRLSQMETITLEEAMRN